MPLISSDTHRPENNVNNYILCFFGKLAIRVGQAVPDTSKSTRILPVPAENSVLVYSQAFTYNRQPSKSYRK